MIEACILVVDKYRRNHLTHIAHLTTTGHNDGSRRDNLVAVRILLGQRKRILTCWNVHTDSAAEV